MRVCAAELGDGAGTRKLVDGEEELARSIWDCGVSGRGFTNTDELWLWHKAVTDGKVERKNGSIIICDDAGGEIMRYNFFEGWPCRWKTSPLSARQRGTLIEEIEIVVEKIEHG